MFKDSIKILLGRILFLFRVHRLLLREKAVIVVVHSVNEEWTTSEINCTPALFRQYCVFFRRYFNVISLTELLQRQQDGRGIGGCLVITFDDGYKDNSEIAAPILLSMGLPATFFVATGFIDTNTITPQDAKLSIESNWMSWDEVVGLARQGFDIGAHTVTHPSLAHISADEALREVCECKSVLESRLGQEVQHFAYPFGGRENISDEGITLIQDANFKSSSSCHGGTVDMNDDPFSLRREPVTSRHQSPYSFAFEFVSDSVR